MAKNNKKVLFTGGHAASTAFVLISEIRKLQKPWKIYWVGAKRTTEGQSVQTLSSLYFPKHDVETFDIITGRIQTRLTVHTLPSLFKIPVGFIHALFLLIKIRPDLIFSFGGYSAFPIVVCGYILRIPIIIHEQTAAVGRSNRYASFFADKITISRKSSEKFFPKRKIILTGNPIPKIAKLQKNRVNKNQTPSILVTGGQSGSRAINDVIYDALPLLLKNYRLIHLTGMTDLAKFKDKKNGLPKEIQKNYQIYPVVDLNDYNTIFRSVDILISRAGANTVSKIIAYKKPSLLIPLPISYLDEQTKNAEYASDFGIAQILPQNELSAERLIGEVDKLVLKKNKMVKNVENKASPDVDASSRIIDIIEREFTHGN